MFSLFKNKKDTISAIESIKSIDRYNVTYIDDLFDKKFKIVDSLSFYYSYKEIFEEKIYDFKSDSDEPRIIDCGANVGLAIMRWKQLYPKARILAFEADPNVFKVLSENINRFQFGNCELYNKAVWNEKTILRFDSEGADAGRLSNLTESSEQKNINEVKTTTLSQFLDKKIDLLKMDIEGAEINVIDESSKVLKNVRNLFIEYHSFANKTQNLSHLLNILEQNNFRYYLQTQFCPANPFKNIDTQYDMDLQINISAINLSHL